MTASRLTLRFFLLATLLASLALLAIRIAGYPALWPLSGARTLIFEALGLLLVYLAAVGFITAPARDPGVMLQRASGIGFAGAAIQIFHLVLEHFGWQPAGWAGPLAISLMLATFALWGVSAFSARRAGDSFARSVGWSAWSALVTMSMVILVGVALELYLAPTPLEFMRSWGEFQRSGWTDLRAFAIANTLDSVGSHLFIGPLAGAIFGALGHAFAGTRLATRTSVA